MRPQNYITMFSEKQNDNMANLPPHTTHTVRERNIALDLLKVIAVLLITNSHFRVLYQDINPALATGGVPGNAMFFFVSGFALTLGTSAKGSYIDFVKNKIRRLLPTFIVWNIFANIFSLKDISWKDFILIPEYWFVQCIFIMYLFIYPFLHMNKKTFMCLMMGSVLIMLTMMLLFPYPDRSVFNDITLRYFCYLTPFIFGLYCGIHNDKIKSQCRHRDGLIGLILFASYFVVISFGKCKENWMYYTEILALIPLNLFILFLYRFFSLKNILKTVMDNKLLFFCIRFFSLLSLQIYVVQFYLITDNYNRLFPLNFLIVFLIILVCAYCLHIFTRLFEQTLSKESWNIRRILHID